VRARHILINIQAGDTTAALAKADSLKRLIKGGKKFADLAKTNSEDFGSANDGGNLNWFTEGTMVKPFNDAVFQGKKGEMPVVVSQFGVHLIEIQDKSGENRKMEIAFVEREIEVSNATDNAVYVEASSFASRNRTVAEFQSAAQEKGYRIETADNLKPGDRMLPGIGQSRDLVRWAFKENQGTVSEARNFENKYVVAAIVEVREEGVAPLAQVKDQVEKAVIRDKKAERFTQEFNTALTGSKTIEEVASKKNLNAESADNVSFGTFSIPGIGREPKVLGTVFGLTKDQLSQPIKGETGVFVLMVNQVTEPEALTDFSFFKNQISSTLTNRVAAEVFEALKTKAEVEDNRYRFY
jgi:peptidyl-prolyl cis-trans isomerase D